MFDDFSLDNLFTDDPKKLGLLVAGLQMIQGAPQRNRNFGADLSQGLLGGLGAYSGAKTAQLAQQKEALQNTLLNLQAKTAEQDYQDQQVARDVFARRRGGAPAGTPASANPTDESAGLNMASPFASQIPQTLLAPPQLPPQPQTLLAGGLPQAPTVVPFGKGVTVTNAPSGASNGKFDTYNKYNSIANDLENAGALKQAQQYRDLAEKYRPKLKDEQVRLGPSGQPVVVRNYEDGTTEVSPFSPTANLQYLDTKNAKLPIDNYTGKMGGQPIPMGIDPADAQRIAIERARLGNEQTRTYFDTGMGGPGGGAGGGGGRAPGGPAGIPGLPPAVTAQIAKSQAEGLNTGGIAYKNNLDTTVQTGNDLMTRIAESRKALEQFKPGMGAETYLNIARAAEAAHMPDGIVSAIAGGSVPAIQEFQKLSAQQAMETLKSAMGGSGRITQAEFKVFQANNPNIELDPEAIKKIYNFAERTHRRNVAEQAGLNSYLKEGGNISQWPTEWTKRIGGGTPPASGFRYLGKE